MKVVVMAGGQGTRLRPLTSNQPKPMLPVLGQPLMQHILRLACRHGFTDAVATVQFLASIIRNHFGDGSDIGMSLEYATEDLPLGTAGSVKNAELLLDDRFLVISGDALTDLDLTDLVRFHQSRGAAVTVTLKRVEDPLEFGIVITDDEGRIDRFLEKPGWGDVFSDTINTGIYVVERDVLDYIPSGEDFDFSKDLFPLLLEKGLPMYGYVTDRYWSDVGTIDAYTNAHRDVLDRKVEVEIPGFELRQGVWLGEGAELDPEASVQGPVFIGENTKIEGGADLREYTVLGRGVAVKPGATLNRAIVHDYAYIGSTASLRGCVVGKNSDIKYGARLEEGVVVGEQSYVGEGAVLNPYVKVYPFKSVDPGAIVSESIIWQTAGAKGLFGERGVSGLVNVDITPEMAVRLALAYSSLLPKRSVVVACRDATRVARIVKRSLGVGVNAAGLDCHDLELVPSPVARFYARSARAAGGFTVRTTPGDPDSVDIQFFDERGIDVDPSTQRRLERAYFRDDLRRAFHHDIGDLAFPPRSLEYYVGGLLQAIDREAIAERRPKLVVDYAFGGAAVTGPAVLGRVKAQVLALNGVLDEERVVLTDDDVAAHMRALAAVVGSSGAHFGVMLNSPGERISLVDERGRIVDGPTALLAMVWLVARTSEGPRVAVPVAASRVVEEIVQARGGSVRWTRLSPAALMAAADGDDLDLAGGEVGDFIFPEFIPVFDGVMSLLKLIELLAATDRSLGDVVDQLPKTHVARRDVPVPWESKGTVMRQLLERFGDQQVLTIDGIKVFRDRDWALVVPHPQEPLVRVWAEGASDQAAYALAEEFAALVEVLK